MPDWISHSVYRKLGMESRQGCWGTVGIPIHTDFLEGLSGPHRLQEVWGCMPRVQMLRNPGITRESCSQGKCFLGKQ